MARPVLGITMGDAAGIGPEIIVKALNDPGIYERSRPLAIGDAKLLERAGRIVRTGLAIRSIQQPAEARYQPGAIDCLDLDLLPADLPFGELSAKAGDSAFRFIATAVELARAGQIDAIVTAPLNKEALHKGGHIYPGPTEILAELTGTPGFPQMLTARNLRVAHPTNHGGPPDARQRV